jgi:amidase
VIVKDNFETVDLPTTAGSLALAGWRPAQDATMVARLRAAGAVVLAKSNMAEWAFTPYETVSSILPGYTKNPYALDRVTAGSSGGSAAAVAAGMVPLAHGNDGGGSIRIPAACCGLVGLKPSRGRVSVGPDMGESFLASNGVLTRTVADTAHALDVISGYEVGDANWAPKPAEPYATAMRRDPGKLRVAVTAANPLGITPPSDALDGVRIAAEILQGVGHEVTEVTPPFPPAEVLDAFINVFGPAIALGIESAVRINGREPGEDEIEPLSRELLDRARITPAIAYMSTLAQLQALARRLVGFFADYDVLLTPALGERPLRIGECHGYGTDPMRDLARSGVFTPYTSLFNVTGQPAISVPIGLGSDGLPTGVQIVGRPLAEDRLLQLARQLEYANPWAHLRPGDPRSDL